MALTICHKTNARIEILKDYYTFVFDMVYFKPYGQPNLLFRKLNTPKENKQPSGAGILSRKDHKKVACPLVCNKDRSDSRQADHSQRPYLASMHLVSTSSLRSIPEKNSVQDLWSKVSMIFSTTCMWFSALTSRVQPSLLWKDQV